MCVHLRQRQENAMAAAVSHCTAIQCGAAMYSKVVVGSCRGRALNATPGTPGHLGEKALGIFHKGQWQLPTTRKLLSCSPVRAKLELVHEHIFDKGGGQAFYPAVAPVVTYHHLL